MRVDIPLRNSLSYKQARNCLLVGLLIGLVLSSVQIAIDYASHKQETFDKIEHLVSTAKLSATHAAYNLNDTEANQIVTGLVAYGPILEASIRDDFDDVLAIAHQPAVAVPLLNRWLFGEKRYLSIELRDDSIGEGAVGELRLAVDLAVQAETLIQRAVVVLTLGIVRNVLLVLALIYVFHLTITRSLLKISSVLKASPKPEKIPVPHNHKHDELGVLVGTFNEHLDVIEEQHNEIVRINESMEDLVEIRTKQLADKNRELSAEREIAVKANLAKTDFLAMMSHEIRTPLNGIQGMTQLMLAEKLNEKQLDWLSTISTSCNSLLSIINSILDYVREGKDTQDIKRSDFNLWDCVTNVVCLLKSNAEGKGIALDFSIAEGVPPVVCGDENRLRQVLLNLINNSIKFTHRGGIAVRVLPAGHGHMPFRLRVEVEDTGIGIPEGFQSQVFEAFTQADLSMNRLYSGVGLGLSVCKILVEKQAGTIGFSSREGEGSLFWFEIPYTGEQGVAPVRALNTVAETVPPMNILLVEDVEANRKYVTALLEKHNHSITQAIHGREALDYLAAGRRFDLVLMDVHMPVMDGIEATRRIRAAGDPALAAIPVIGLTADAASAKRDECLAAGITQVLVKPFKMEELYAAIGVTCLRSRGPAADNGRLEGDAGQGYFDRPTFNRHIEDLGMESVERLFNKAIVSAEQIIKSLPGLLDKQEVSVIGAAVHKLVGLAANYGFIRFKQVASELEQSLKQQSISQNQLRENVELLQQEFERARELVQALFQKA